MNIGAIISDKKTHEPQVRYLAKKKNIENTKVNTEGISILLAKTTLMK